MLYRVVEEHSFMNSRNDLIVIQGRIYEVKDGVRLDSSHTSLQLRVAVPGFPGSEYRVFETTAVGA